MDYPGIDRQPEKDRGAQNLSTGALDVDRADNPGTRILPNIDGDRRADDLSIDR